MASPWAPFEAPPVPPPPPRRAWRPGPAIITLAIAIAVLLIADAAALVAHTFSDDEQAGTGKDAGRSVLVTPDQVPGPTATPLERELPALMRFVQDHRGLRYSRPVKVSLLGDKAFRARLKGSPPTDREAEERAQKADKQERLLKAYGIIEPDLDLSKVASSFYSDAIAGYYDNEHDDLVVRGERLSPSIKTTLVHELTHAIQDQQFNLDRTALEKKDDESATAYTGLVEGDAVRVETMYRESLPEAEQKQAEQEEAAAGGQIDPSIPRAILEIFFLPYLAGPNFTKQLVANGGQARLDEAFAHPPTTSEQLLHPEVFLAGQPVVPVATPKPAGKQFEAGVLGEFGLRLTLETVAGEGVSSAAGGWGGDRYVAWTKNGHDCVRTTVAMDTPAALNQLRAALRRFADRRKGTTVTGPAAGPVTFTTCD